MSTQPILTATFNNNLTTMNAWNKWKTEENDRLKKSYNEDKLDVNEIAKLHKRTVNAIVSKLVSLKIIEHIYDARGFNDYQATIKKELDESGVACICKIRPLQKAPKAPRKSKSVLVNKCTELEGKITNLEEKLENLRIENYKLDGEVDKLKAEKWEILHVGLEMAQKNSQLSNQVALLEAKLKALSREEVQDKNNGDQWCSKCTDFDSSSTAKKVEKDGMCLSCFIYHDRYKKEQEGMKMRMKLKDSIKDESESED